MRPVQKRRPRFFPDNPHSPNPRAADRRAAQVVESRLVGDISRRLFLGGAAAALAPFAAMRPGGAFAQSAAAENRPVLFTNIRLFDSAGRRMREGVSILVRGKKVEALLAAAETVEGADVIDCGGRLAMPGLIDTHWHCMLCAVPMMVAMTADVGYLYLAAAKEAGNTLMRGFTSLRDAGGPAFALKRAIDEGMVAGPRIFPSGAMISQTSGHGDFRMRYEVPRDPAAPLSHAEVMGAAAIADGEAEVLRRAREQLMLGATQIKMMAGGGVSSPYDPLDTTQYSEAELRAGVGAAEDWGTYVMVHAYTPRAIQRAIRSGVKSIDHGQLADDRTVRMMASEGVWWSLQPFLADEDANVYADPASRAKQMEVSEGTVQAFALAKRHRVKTAWGTDLLFAPQNLPNQARHLAKLTRFYDPLDLLALATGDNGQLLALSGPRNPYDGALGVIAPGAMADILIADGDPTSSLDFLTDPEANLKIIMKDGRIHKDTLRS